MEARRVTSSELSLKPQSKTVLLHLEKHGRISNAKADRVYGITRLAACIYDLRKVGKQISTSILTDESGHRYSEYRIDNAQ